MKLFQLLLVCLVLTFNAFAGKVNVVVAPNSVTLTSGGTQQFTANQNVSWSASAGTISSGGLFTAPSVGTNTIVTVTAKTLKPPRTSGTAQVTVKPVVVVQHTVTLSWTLSTTPDVTSYNVYRKVVGGSYALEASALSPTSTSWVDNTVGSGQTYVYAMTAFDTDGDGESILSNEVTLSIP